MYIPVMMSSDLSKKFNPHVQTVTRSADFIVTQLLHYHMLLLYCMQPFNFETDVVVMATFFCSIHHILLLQKQNIGIL